jgi:hypothetical protein
MVAYCKYENRNQQIILILYFYNCVLRKIRTGKRVDGRDPKLKRFIEALPVDFDLPKLVSFFPSLLPFIPGWMYGLKKLQEDRDVLYAFSKVYY